MLETNTSRPAPRCRIAGSTAWATRRAPKVLSWKSFSTSASGTLSNGARIMVPPYIAAGTRVVVLTEDFSYHERAKD